jgi:uncharacterized protein YcgI (DUF1989 family)
MDRFTIHRGQRLRGVHKCASQRRGRFEIRKSSGEPGDYYDLRAEMDLFVAVIELSEGTQAM